MQVRKKINDAEGEYEIFTCVKLNIIYCVFLY